MENYITKITKITVDVGGEKVSLDFDKVINNYLNQPLSTKTVFALTKELTEVLYRAGYNKCDWSKVIKNN